MNKSASVPSSRSSLERRKQPTQKRAKATVDKILQAANELIDEEGFDAVGTGRIAERADVNIASLYQYFPNRETILFALYEEAANEGARKLNALAMSIHNDDLETVVPKIIKLLLAHYEQNSAILLRMFGEVAEIRRGARVVPFENIIRSSIQLFLHQHPEYRPRETTRHIFFLQNLVVGNLRNYVLDPPPDLKKKDFVMHLCRIIVAYLKGEVA